MQEFIQFLYGTQFDARDALGTAAVLAFLFALTLVVWGTERANKELYQQLKRH